jgi:hypothetical protein
VDKFEKKEDDRDSAEIVFDSERKDVIKEA